MHVLCIFSTNLTLGIRTKDLHNIVHSRKPVVVPPQPKTTAPPKLKVPEPLLDIRAALSACDVIIMLPWYSRWKRFSSCLSTAQTDLLKFWPLDVWQSLAVAVLASAAGFSVHWVHLFTYTYRIAILSAAWCEQRCSKHPNCYLLLFSWRHADGKTQGGLSALRQQRNSP